MKFEDKEAVKDAGHFPQILSCAMVMGQACARVDNFSTIGKCYSELD